MNKLLTVLTAAAIGLGAFGATQASAQMTTSHTRVSERHETRYHHKRQQRVCKVTYRHNQKIRRCRTVWR